MFLFFYFWSLIKKEDKFDFQLIMLERKFRDQIITQMLKFIILNKKRG